ncbi:MAG: CNNM domain-containing protein, partial [Cyanobacteria bacterium P01_F01_bin.4]
MSSFAAYHIIHRLFLTMIQLAIAVLIVLLGSALCSGTEAALLSVPLLKARQLANTRKPAAIALLAIREKINRPIAPSHLPTNLYTIVGSLLSARIATVVLGD